MAFSQSFGTVLFSTLLAVSFPCCVLVTIGDGIKVFILLCYVSLTSDLTRSFMMKLIWCLYSALQASLCFGNNIVEAVSNYSFCFVSLVSWDTEESREDTFHCYLSFPLSFTSPSSPRPFASHFTLHVRSFTYCVQCRCTTVQKLYKTTRECTKEGYKAGEGSGGQDV